MSARPSWCLGLLCGLWSAAAVADFPQAMTDYNAGNYDAARAEFLTLAALGDAPSQFNLGAMATQGQGQPKDAGAAVGWFSAAAENGGRQLPADKLASMRARLNDAERATADDIVAHYGRAALEKTALPVPPLGAQCRNFQRADATQVTPGDYPARGRYGNQDGLVILRLHISAAGTASDPEILMAVPGPEFAASAINTWMKAHFTPATQDGQPVESHVLAKAVFRMRDGGVLWDFGALKELREQALTGAPAAQYKIGLAATLDSSLGIPASQAYRLLVSAAQGGSPGAQYWAAGNFISVASCNAQDKHLPWLQAAADGGDGPALLALAQQKLSREPSAEQQLQARLLLVKAAQTNNYYVQKHVIALLAAAPLPALHDPETASAAAAHLAAWGVEADPQMYEALAAAEAASGDYWKAGNNEWTAVKRAKELNWTTQLMEERLALYRKSRAWSGDLFAFAPPAAARAATR
jgi:TPR repeat protein